MVISVVCVYIIAHKERGSSNYYCVFPRKLKLLMSAIVYYDTGINQCT